MVVIISKGQKAVRIKKEQNIMKKFLICALLTVGILGLVGAGTVSAHGWFGGCDNGQFINQEERHENMIQTKAEILGLNIDELNAAKEQGKCFHEIIEEQDLTMEQFRERMKELKSEQRQNRLNQFVTEGKITQEQADERLEAMNNRFENGEMGKGFHKGFGGNFGLKNSGLK